MIFRKIADEYDDSYWKNFYENCAEGKFPKDVIYTNDSISVKVKKEWKIYPISKHSEEKQISDITSVFSEYFDISREVSKSNRKTKRNVDDTMIQNFIDKIRENEKNTARIHVSAKRCQIITGLKSNHPYIGNIRVIPK